MKSDFEILSANPEFRKLLAVETLVADAGELIARLMESRGVNRAELARRLGKSRAWVTQMLNGRANLTLKTLAEVAWALEAEVQLAERGAPAAQATLDTTGWKGPWQVRVEPASGFAAPRSYEYAA
jgi:ribosome-binding protein aMBF1 (putative translation factor)